MFIRNKYKRILKTSLIGGFVVIIPIAILAGIFGWLFDVTKSLMNPLTLFIIDKSGTQEMIALVMAVMSVLIICFIVGVVVKTKSGSFFHSVIENNMLTKIPFYKIIKEIVSQFNASGKQPFSKVAVVNIFGKNIMMTAFVTDETKNKLGETVIYTVFVPTGPNPTSGNIYHLSCDRVYIVDVSVETAMKSIIACGSGSECILKEHLNNTLY